MVPDHRDLPGEQAVEEHEEGVEGRPGDLRRGRGGQADPHHLHLQGRRPAHGREGQPHLSSTTISGSCNKPISFLASIGWEAKDAYRLIEPLVVPPPTPPPPSGGRGGLQQDHETGGWKHPDYRGGSGRQ